MIGAEQTGRRAFAMELDPAYCDVIIRRWQEATGEPARLGESDTTYESVASARGVVIGDGDENRDLGQ